MAVAFSRWLSNGKCSIVLARQSMYGRAIERIYGDLAPHPDCPARWKSRAAWFMESFFVDAKRRKSFSLGALLASPNHRFWEWRDKALSQGGQKRVLLVLMERQRRLVCGLPPDVQHGAPVARIDRKAGEPFDVAYFLDLPLWLAAAEPEYWGCPRDEAAQAAERPRHGG